MDPALDTSDHLSSSGGGIFSNTLVHLNIVKIIAEKLIDFCNSVQKLKSKSFESFKRLFLCRYNYGLQFMKIQNSVKKNQTKYSFT